MLAKAACARTTLQIRDISSQHPPAFRVRAGRCIEHIDMPVWNRSAYDLGAKAREKLARNDSAPSGAM